MASMKSVMRELKQAVVDGMGQVKDKLHQLWENFVEFIRKFIRKIKGNDNFDAPDTSPRADPPGLGPDRSRKPPSMSDDEYRSILESSVHNPDGLEAVLGKFRHGDTPSYIAVAEGKNPPGTYFSLGDQWGTIADRNNMTDNDMFDAFNVPFLERMMAEGKPITFSHDPRDFPGSALGDELQFLLDNGYVFDPVTMQAYLP